MQVLIQIDLDLKEGKHNYMSPPDTGAPVNFEVQTPPYGRILSSLGTNKLKFKPILLDHHIGFLFLKKRRSYVSQKKKIIRGYKIKPLFIKRNKVKPTVST